MYTPDPKTVERLKNDHMFHPASPDQQERYKANRDAALALGMELLKRCPPSRELSVALTALDEVVFWSNAAIARNE